MELNMCLINVILFIGVLQIPAVDGQCTGLQRCYDCYLSHPDTSCKGDAVSVSEAACIDYLNSPTSVYIVTFNTGGCRRWTCSGTSYQPSSKDTITYRLGGCSNGCSDITLYEYADMTIIGTPDEDPPLTLKECRNHCADIAFSGYDCSLIHDGTKCNIYSTSCPAGGCTRTSSSGSRVEVFACDFTVTKCSTLSDPLNGVITLTGTLVGDTASYVCNTGYIADITVVRTCGSTGLWDGSQPTCSLIDCQQPWGLTNGTVNVGATTFSQIASYSCYDGYTLTGSNKVVCQSDGTWNGTQPFCDPVHCGPPGSVTNGNMSVTSTHYPGKALYECDIGYTLNGSPMLSCHTNASWIGTPPSCDPVSCGTPSPVVNGLFNVNSYNYQGTVNYVCDSGYVLNGVSTFICQADGIWSGPSPSCDPVNCGTPTSINNGTFNVTSTDYLSSVVYYCQDGYNLNGNPVLICQADGTWNDTAPSCNPVSCSTPVPIANGYFNIQSSLYQGLIDYGCDNGYILTGSSTRTCQLDGHWDGIDPSCDPIDCFMPSDLHNGTISINGTTYLKTANYSCNAGFTLVGSETRTCEANGNWTGPGFDPYCIVDCGQPEQITNGDVTYNNTTVGSEANYTCHSACMVSGNTQITCLASSSWSLPVPSCSCPECEVLTDPLNGAVTTSNGKTMGSIATYTCNVGYMMSGPRVRTCMPSGIWTTKQPKCEPIAPVYIAACLCNENKQFVNMSEDEIIKQLVQDTAIDTKATTLSQQQLKCTEDDRQSSAIIGSVGVFVFGAIFGLLFLIDCITLCQKTCKVHKQKHLTGWM